jgi:hypothetical protein
LGLALIELPVAYPRPPGNYYENFGGSVVNSICADGTAVPVPPSVTVFGMGLSGTMIGCCCKKHS